MIKLYTSKTPNGYKPIIMLEELKLKYQIKNINLSENEQFLQEFVEINPYAKIPAIKDQENNLDLFESGAILIYLAEKNENKFLPENGEKRYKTLNWLMFQMGNLGPMIGQYMHFNVFAEENVPYAKERYSKETHRVLKAMEEKLKNYPYLAGQDYTIADIATYPWIRGLFFMRGQEFEMYENVKKWKEKIDQREAVKKAYSIEL